MNSPAVSKGFAVVYCTAGGIMLFSGIKGATLSDTVKAILSGSVNVQDTETIALNNGSSGGSSSAPSAASGGSATGQQIIGAALRYNGHKYVFGGPSNPQNGWDCSSFASYVLGHDLGMSLPGGQSWAAATNNGASHGPVASEFNHTPRFAKAGNDPKSNMPGDLLVWTGHVGFGTGNGGMFSAFDTASGTLATSASAPYSYEGTYRAS
jgi:cell wall-associated NlpC family hydrolase